MEEIEFIYLGRRITQSDKVAHAFILQSQIDAVVAKYDISLGSKIPSLATEEIERRCSLFKMKRSPSSVGSKYKHPGEIENGRVARIAGGNPKWAGSETANAAFVMAWSMADDSAYQMQKRKLAEKKAENDPRLLDAIAILQQRYQKILPADRRAFRLWLLDEIEKRGK